MQTFNIYEAKTQLSKLVERAMAGEEITIAKAGEPMVTLTPCKPKDGWKRPLGFDDGKFEIPDAFYDPLPHDILGPLMGLDPDEYHLIDEEPRETKLGINTE